MPEQNMPHNLLYDALELSRDVRVYQIGRALSELFPDKSVIEFNDSLFDVDSFVRGGHCTVTPRNDLYYQYVVSFVEIGKPLDQSATNGGFDILWKGNRLQMLFCSWPEQHFNRSHYWLIAETAEISRQFYYDVCAWSAEVRGEVLVFNSGCWTKDEKLFQAIKSATFNNLTLPPGQKQEIQDDFAQFLSSRAIYEQYGIPWKRGVLLIGPPGNGKTHTVKALLNWLNVPCLYVKSFKHPYNTVQQCIQSVFARARQTTPCVLVMEDLDSLIDDQNRAFFLNELDGFAANTGIILLATTNHPDRLDPALVDRPSRFDRKYYFELPGAAERFAYMKSWNAQLDGDLHQTDEDLVPLVEATNGFSFAYLKELFLSALMRWISNPVRGKMSDVLREQCGVLREQMHAMNDVPPPETDAEENDDAF